MELQDFLKENITKRSKKGTNMKLKMSIAVQTVRVACKGASIYFRISCDKNSYIKIIGDHVLFVMHRDLIA